MSQDWQSLPNAEIVMRLANDPRPAWLWAGDGKDPLWTNRAAELFGARLKASGLRRTDPATPVRGQISRILRLGLVGRPMLSRMQFLAGRKPLSATCQCTPIDLGGDRPYLLAVGVDAIDEAILATDGAPAADAAAPAAEPVDDEPTDVADDLPVSQEGPHISKPALDDEVAAEESGDDTRSELRALVDRLARHEPNASPLVASDPAPLPEMDIAQETEPGYSTHEGDGTVIVEQPTPDDGDGPSDEEAAFAADSSADEAPERAGLWQVTGRGLNVPRASYEPTDAEASGETGADLPPAANGTDRASRYNFEELSRILTDRVGREEPQDEPDGQSEPKHEQPASVIPLRPTGALVPLSEESLVLNRLPIGILIFRDQDIVFVNRALVDMTGHENAMALRHLGLTAILPTVDASEPAGPVTHLMRKDGEKIAVSARLQAVSWQGRPGFMLTARVNEIEPLRESEVRQFAGLWARTAGYGFVTADRAGLIDTHVPAREGKAITQGTPLTNLVAMGEAGPLRNFLSLPSRYAGGVRPAVALKGSKAGETLTLFAEGRAGIVTGYFGLIGGAASASKPPLPSPALGRITRGLRRPLNTIAGFSELMVSEAFGAMGNARYAEYARDIRAAGAEIGDLADELDDYMRIAEGEVPLSPADIDIGTLLAECLVRVRGQAGKARVLLRSAISERLPFVRVDAATLKQVVLNMLASAISQASQGARVVLSGQVEDDGAVSIHVRDAAKGPNALAEQFVVFRDGIAADGTERVPSRSSIGLTLTRSLVAVNACSLSLEPSSESGTLMTLTIPASLVVSR